MADRGILPASFGILSKSGRICRKTSFGKLLSEFPERGVEESICGQKKGVNPFLDNCIQGGADNRELLILPQKGVGEGNLYSSIQMFILFLGFLY